LFGEASAAGAIFTTRTCNLYVRSGGSDVLASCTGGTGNRTIFRLVAVAVVPVWAWLLPSSFDREAIRIHAALSD
jgi:hypothetical protein